MRLPDEVRRWREEAGVSISPVAGWALIDTGADISAFDTRAASQAGLRPTGGSDLLRHAEDGTYRVPTFDGDLTVEGLKTFRVREARGLYLARLGFVALIGRDFLIDLQLVCDGPAQTVRMLR